MAVHVGISLWSRQYTPCKGISMGTYFWAGVATKCPQQSATLDWTQNCVVVETTSEPPLLTLAHWHTCILLTMCKPWMVNLPGTDCYRSRDHRERSAERHHSPAVAADGSPAAAAERAVSPADDDMNGAAAADRSRSPDERSRRRSRRSRSETPDDDDDGGRRPRDHSAEPAADGDGNGRGRTATPEEDRRSASPLPPEDDE